MVDCIVSLFYCLFVINFLLQFVFGYFCTYRHPLFFGHTDAVFIIHFCVHLAHFWLKTTLLNTFFDSAPTSNPWLVKEPFLPPEQWTCHPLLFLHSVTWYWIICIRLTYIAVRYICQYYLFFISCFFLWFTIYLLSCFVKVNFPVSEIAGPFMCFWLVQKWC